jgi:hypothetical protein
LKKFTGYSNLHYPNYKCAYFARELFVLGAISRELYPGNSFKGTFLRKFLRGTLSQGAFSKGTNSQIPSEYSKILKYETTINRFKD